MVKHLEKIMIKPGKILLLAALVGALFLTATTAQEPSSLELAVVNNGQTFVVQTGTAIKLSLDFTDVSMTYDAAVLQPLEINGRSGISGMQLLKSLVPTMPNWMPHPDVGVETQPTHSGPQADQLSDSVYVKETQTDTDGTISSIMAFGESDQTNVKFLTLTPGETTLTVYHIPASCPVSGCDRELAYTFTVMIEGDAYTEPRMGLLLDTLT
jgi:hypothetical protein